MRWGRATLVAALLAFAAGCGGSGADKAGGRDVQVRSPVGKPVTLSLITVDDLWSSEYAAAVSRLSGGSIRIKTQLGGSALLDYEQRFVQKVRAGDHDMTSVGARAWDRLGVQTFPPMPRPVFETCACRTGTRSCRCGRRATWSGGRSSGPHSRIAYMGEVACNKRCQIYTAIHAIRLCKPPETLVFMGFQCIAVM